MRPFGFGPGPGGQGRFGHGGMGHGMHGGGGRGGKRIFEHGDMRLLMLALLEEQPAHGYELIKQIEERMHGAYAPSPGIVYPTLTLLEELGLAVSEDGEGGRKRYSVSDAGREFLDSRRAELDVVRRRMEEATARHRRSETPQIVRAVENLRTALRLKCEGVELTPEEVKIIATALDEAAARIESC